MQVSCFYISSPLPSGNDLGLPESASYAYEFSVLSVGLQFDDDGSHQGREVRHFCPVAANAQKY